MDRHAVPADLPPEGALERLFTVLAESIANMAAERPLLLVLDDLHWADDLSLRFLGQLPATFFADLRLLLLGTYRSDEVTPSLRQLLDTRGIETMTVGRLNEAAINSLVADMLALPDAPPSLMEFLVRHSNGNPFFVAEYLRAAVAEGLLYRESGRWQAVVDSRSTDLQGRMALPSSLRDLVSRRLDGLDDRARGLVEAAATLGRDFEIELLQAMTGVDDQQLFGAPERFARPACARADGRSAIRVRASSDPRHRVPNGSTWIPASAASLGRDEPSSRCIATTRTFRCDSSPGQALGRRGRDCQRRRVPGQSRRLRAAHLGVHGHGPALRQGRRFERETPVARTDPRRASTAGDRRSVARPRRLRQQPPPPRPRGLDSRLPAAGNERPADSGAARRTGAQVVRRLGPARAAPPVSTVHDEAARAYANLQIAWRYTENPGLVLIYTALRCLNLAERGAGPATSAMAFSQAVVLSATVPLHAAARRYEQLANAALARTTDGNAHSFAPIALSVYHTGIGNWDTAAAYAGRSAADRPRRRLPPAPGRCTHGVRVRRDRAVAAAGSLADLHGSQRIRPRRGSQRGRIWSIGALGVLALRTGDRREAEARLREFEALRPAELDPSDCVRLDAAAGLLAAHLDEPGARKSLDRALDALEKVPPVLIESIDPCVRLAEAYVMLMRKAAAFGGTEMAELDKQFTRTCAYAQRLAKRFPIVVPDERHWRAEADWLLGRQSAALKHWQGGLAAAERMAMVYHRWRAHQSLADHHPDASEAARHRSRRGRTEGAHRCRSELRLGRTGSSGF